MKKYFTGCFACWSGYKCAKKQHIPRKQKKKYKKLLILISEFYFPGYDVCLCDISSSFSNDKKLLKLFPFFLNFNREIDILVSHLESKKDFAIDENGRLCWVWEDDDDLGGTSGIMPFCYSEEEAGRTWAYSQLVETVESFFDFPEDFVFPESIKSDKDLLRFIRKNNIKKSNL